VVARYFMHADQALAGAFPFLICHIPLVCLERWRVGEKNAKGTHRCVSHSVVLVFSTAVVGK
ncbi:MAG: hypothetical protein ACFCBU_15900, partial [Cyanophyceae cyanobacterium]